jgi:hypothetical protein
VRRSRRIEPETRSGHERLRVASAGAAGSGTLGDDPSSRRSRLNEVPLGAGDEQAIVLTDDYDPIEHFDRDVLVGWREGMIRQCVRTASVDAGS